MRFEIELVADPAEETVLPIQYNHLVQSMLYQSLDSDFADFLHDQGFKSKSRRFRLFVFSRLMGRFRMDTANGTIIFQSPVKLIISSPINEFCQSLINGFLARKFLRLGHNLLQVEKINVERPVVKSNILKVKSLSPVVAYSTLLKPEGGKYTCYFQPGESEFARLINVNLRNKYMALYNEEAPEGEIKTRPLRTPKLHVMSYKGVVIKGYSSFLQLQGPQALLQLALDAGLGSKNSMGFGCVEPVA